MRRRRTWSGSPAFLGIAAALTVAAATAVWPTGCSSPRERYRVLSFFFDGVPDPDAPKKTAGGPGKAATTTTEPSLAAAAQGAEPAGSKHKPVAEGKCAKCHGSAGGGGTGAGAVAASFTDVDPSSFSNAVRLCATCHAKPEEVGPRAAVLAGSGWLHGPVAEGDCARCHESHDSPFRHLLRVERAETICLDCHDHLPPRSGPMAKLDCTGCHDPHRADGPGQRFLKGGAEALCLSCHGAQGTHSAKWASDASRTWLHAPVLAGLCTTCHDPHGGGLRHLRQPLREVCLSCHERGSIEANPVHQNALAARRCESCHDPHAAKSAGQKFVRTRRVG